MRDVAVVHSAPDGLIARLSELGYNGIACPLLTIHPLEFSLTADFDAALVTSRHAVLAARHSGLPVIAVGGETAEAAQEEGVTVIATGEGHASSLQGRADIRNKRIVHLSGTHIAPGTEELLNALNATRVHVYEARLSDEFPIPVIHSLEQGKLHAALMFSARAARHFTGLAKRATNNDLWRHVAGVALSARIADAMDGLPFASLRIAAAPNRNAVLEALVNE